MKFFSVILLIASMPAFAGFALTYEQKGVQELMREVESSLPAVVKDGINEPVKIVFQKIEIKGKVVQGMVKVNPFNRKGSRTILINEKLLIEENYHKAKATILHEIGHIFDNQNLRLPLEGDLRERRSYSISDSRIFLNLGNWKKSKQTNKKISRSVDQYENKNPQEFFAVNFEHFLMDPEYKCRRPSLFQYFKENFDHSPFPHARCEQEYRLKPMISLNGESQLVKSFDPSRLYEVHYLFAGKGTNMMSRWGHSMLRLVMCSPKRKEVMEECLQDRAHHIVVSFRADITNFNINYLKGLMGKYPSKMFILSLSDVVKEYTVGEFRDLYSIPLQMNPEQKRRLISQVLERYWTYEGRYYFLSNNCADETLKLLRNVYLEESELTDLEVLSPVGLRRKLDQFGITDPQFFDDLEQKKHLGYFFESLRPKLERIFATLRERNVIPITSKEIENFLDSSTIEERIEISSQVQDKDTLGKLLFIEETILNRNLLVLQKSIGGLLDKEDRKDFKGDLITAFNELESVKGKLSGLDLTHGYGIPLKSDRIFENSAPAPETIDQYRKLQSKFLSLLQARFSKEQNNLSRIMLHKKTLLNQMLGKEVL